MSARTRGHARAALAVVLLGAGWPVAARADAVDEATKLMERGFAAYEAGHLDAALAAYLAAAALVPVASGPDRELARCYDDLGRHREALTHYRAYLIKKPDAPDRADVETRIGALEKVVPPEPPTTAAEPPGAVSSPALTAGPSSGSALTPSPPRKRSKLGWIVGGSIGAAVLVGGAIFFGLLFAEQGRYRLERVNLVYDGN